MRTIKKGDKGKEIELLHNILQKYGYTELGEKEFNDKTASAIVDFQKKRGLTPDGIVGYNTWEVLLFDDCNTTKTLSTNDYKLLAMLLDCEAAALMAIKEVETGNRRGFVAPNKPTILFEGHIFCNELKKRGFDIQELLRGNENIIYEKWCRNKYIGGIGEYKRLEQARKIDREAADSATSWGVFQIMGFNHALCGEKSVADFVDAMHIGERKQLLLAGRFMKNSGLLPSIRKKEWQEFARRYNGPEYSLNKYDKKLHDAYLRLSASLSAPEYGREQQ